MHDLGMRHVGKTYSLASHAISDRTACCKLLQNAKNDASFLPTIITGDET
jgi:hypothetical protein